MSEKGFSEFILTSVKGQEEAMELVERLFDVAEPDAVYSEPVFSGDYAVITACEVSVGMGFAYGFGSGTGPTPTTEETEEAGEFQEGGVGIGGGGGGGGGAGGRPVAAIIVGPDGVRVEPVFDLTKIALAFFTTLGSMFMMMGKMRKASRK
jgi:uncharacterized spore protein YtfJ